jgi:hypothetical protein
MGSNTIHHSAPALGSDLLATMAQLVERATAFGGSRSRWLRPRRSSSKKRFIVLGLDFRILDSFLVEEIAEYRDVWFRCHAPSSDRQHKFSARRGLTRAELAAEPPVAWTAYGRKLTTQRQRSPVE